MYKYQWRIKTTAVITAIFFLIIIGRIWYISRPDSLQIPGWNKYKIPKIRGAILDRNGAYLALTSDAASIFLRPAKFKGTRHDLLKVAKLLNMSSAELDKQLKSGTSKFVWLKRQVSAETGRRIKALNLEGIEITDEPRRLYPNGTLAAPLLGFTGVDHIGLTGVEKYYDKLLLPADKQSGKINNIFLTIDRFIQFIVEDELKKAIKKHRAGYAVGLVYDSTKGEFLAMGSLPSFDPNRFAKSPQSNYLNRAVSIPYEPGSTFKIFTAAYLLKNKAVSYREKIKCPGKIHIYDHTVHCTRAHGYLNLPGVLQESCNVGTILFSRRIRSDRFYRFLKRLGFGEHSKIGLPGDRTGLLHPPSNWSGLSKPMISIGHEISVTPVQLICAAAAVVSSGRTMHPAIIKAVVDWNGRLVSTHQPKEKRRIFSPAVARDLYKMLLRVVKDGTGKLAAVEGVSVAGKTGTANIPKPDGSGYYKHRYNSSFIGFLPVKNSHLVILVIINRPRGAYYGGTIAAPVFKNISKRILFYLKKKAE